jgi:choline kinase
VPFPSTVVVSAAGLGTRMGLNKPKALLELAGRPLIHWQLAMLADVDDVRVVAGYHAADVTDAVFAARPDATVVLNHEYVSTGTAASLMRGVAHADGPVLSLDCDLVVHPEDLRAFLATPAPALGVVPTQSLQPVAAEVTQSRTGPVVSGFDHENTDTPFEWSGLVSFDPTDPRLGPDRGHVFELVAPLLPLPARQIRARELDYPDEVESMTRWIESLLQEGALS